MRITEIDITPVAVKDPPLLNAVGVHQPYALRAVVQVHTDAGITGLGESYGGDATLDLLRTAARALTGAQVADLVELERRVRTALRSGPAHPGGGIIGAASRSRTVSTVLAPFEVACLDAWGHAVGQPVSTLLGGAVRDRVPFSGYLFYKWARHPEDPGYPADDWGEALTVQGVVAQARRMVEEYGFGSLKLKAGVLRPEQEAEAIEALHEGFPDHPLRIDPNAAWTVRTAIAAGRRLDGLLEYLEDPTPGVAGMAEVARAVSMPLATNMCVVEPAHLRPALLADAVRIVLTDHHLWGGLRASQTMAAACHVFGLGVSMHSNTHLGISLAAMTHLAAAAPDLTYACDTHRPWTIEDVVVPGPMTITGGAVTVPTTPGLGVELDHDALARLHEQWRHCGIRRRDDVAARQVAEPGWTRRLPRF